MADVRGQAEARRALEIAAAGSHGVLLVGPPGSGKSMLAQRFAGLLPPMQAHEALESAAVRSLAGRFHPGQRMQRPTVHPHHSCFWTNFQNLPAAPWKHCASRWKAATSPLRVPRSGPNFRRAFSSLPP